MIKMSSWLNLNEICIINNRLADLEASFMLDTSKGADYLMNLINSYDIAEFNKIQKYYNLLD